MMIALYNDDKNKNICNLIFTKLLNCDLFELNVLRAARSVPATAIKYTVYTRVLKLYFVSLIRISHDLIS